MSERTPEAIAAALDYWRGRDRETRRSEVEGEAAAALRRLSARCAALEQAQALVNAQAEDEGLWFVAETISEGYLQQELRRLHAAIEGDLSTPSEEPQR